MLAAFHGGLDACDLNATKLGVPATRVIWESLAELNKSRVDFTQKLFYDGLVLLHRLRLLGRAFLLHLCDVTPQFVRCLEFR